MATTVMVAVTEATVVIREYLTILKHKFLLEWEYFMIEMNPIIYMPYNNGCPISIWCNDCKTQHFHIRI